MSIHAPRAFSVVSVFLLAILVNVSALFAQDTVRVSLDEFIKRGLEKSGQIKYERQSVKLAENRINQAKSKRFLPKFELSTQHGLIPGVVSDSLMPNGKKLPEDEYYLDPNLDNDWQDWAIFTRAEVNAVQPIFTWGGLSNAVKAAQAGAEAAREKFQSDKRGLELRLYDLYNSYLLALEIERTLEEANEQIDRIEERLEEMREEGSEDYDESDYYKFRVYKSQFEIRAEEVRLNLQFIRNVWDYVLQAGENQVYLPENPYLDPVAEKLQPLDYYRQNALKERNEIQGIEAGIEAAQFGLKAQKAQSLPMLYLGLTASYANTPNRPRQDNPFIINNTNYSSAGFGLGIRQNLDLFSIKSEIRERQLQLNRVKFLKEAAVDGIIIDINNKYKEASLSDVKVEKTNDALVVSKQWLRQEQLDYDFGMGEVKDLVDAMKKKLELQVEFKRNVFEFNKNMAELYRAAGVPIERLGQDN